MQPVLVKELPEIIAYILVHQLEDQYRKAKIMLQSGHPGKLDFKMRQPKKYQVYQFRINQKYRAFGVFRDTEKFGRIFLVTEISDHQ
jgi:hypothetical protein